LRITRSTSMQKAKIDGHKKAFLKKPELPEALVFFVTNRCQMRCLFCFYLSRLNTGEKEMGLGQIARLSASLKNIPRLVLTGGEPFLREDLPQICEIFASYNRTRFISIPTNGFLTDKILLQTERILRQVRPRQLRIMVSLDAPEREHDRLRQVEGAFSRAVATAAALKSLSERHRNLYLEIAAVVNKALVGGVEDFISYFRDFRIPIKFSLLRDRQSGIFGLDHEISSGLYGCAAETSLDLPELESFYERVRLLNAASSFKFWPVFQQKKFEYMLRVIREKKRVLPCYAGKVDAVVYPDGEVAFCENTRPIGRLAEADFDFARVWSSEEADKMRERIACCSCTHGCNLVTAMRHDAYTMACSVSDLRFFFFRGRNAHKTKDDFAKKN